MGQAVTGRAAAECVADVLAETFQPGWERVFRGRRPRREVRPADRAARDRWASWAHLRPLASEDEDVADE